MLRASLGVIAKVGRRGGGAGELLAEPGKLTALPPVLRVLARMRSAAFAELERLVLAVRAMAAALTLPTRSQVQYASAGAPR